MSGRALVAGCLSLFATMAFSTEPARISLLDRLRCATSIERQLDLWQINGEVFRAPSGIDGRETYRFATRTLGRWVTLQKDPSQKEAVLMRTSSDGATRVVFDAGCRPEPTELTLAIPEAPGGFTDRDLKDRLDRDSRLVVALWSPHMPLSAEALPEIAAAAREVGVPLVVVSDPSSDPSYVEEVAAERGIDAEARRPLASVELLMRDLAIHAPSILVFSFGKAGAPLPGFRNRAAYTRYLRSIFEEAR